MLTGVRQTWRVLQPVSQGWRAASDRWGQRSERRGNIRQPRCCWHRRACVHVSERSSPDVAKGAHQHHQNVQIHHRCLGQRAEISCWIHSSISCSSFSLTGILEMSWIRTFGVVDICKQETRPLPQETTQELLLFKVWTPAFRMTPHDSGSYLRVKAGLSRDVWVGFVYCDCSRGCCAGFNGCRGGNEGFWLESETFTSVAWRSQTQHQLTPIESGATFKHKHQVWRKFHF